MYKCYNSFQTQAVNGNVSAAEKHGRRSGQIRKAVSAGNCENDGASGSAGKELLRRQEEGLKEEAHSQEAEHEH